MLYQRGLQTSMRRLAFQQTSKPAIIPFLAPAAIATNSHFIQRRQVTQNTPETSSNDLLIKQRLNRPVAPHLSIYRPQITWYASALNRITGSILSGGIYIFGALYLVAPVLGLNLTSASMAAAFGSWPVWGKVLTKMFVALPFTFHSFNGVRHLAWDLGYGFSNPTVIKTGWTVVGASVVSALGLSLFV